MVQERVVEAPEYLASLAREGAVKPRQSWMPPGFAEMAGYSGDAAYTWLYPWDGGPPVRVPRHDIEYQLAKPAPLRNRDGSHKAIVMVRSANGGVFFSYEDGTPFQPAFSLVPPPRATGTAGAAAAVAPSGSSKQAPRRRHRGSRGRGRR